MNYSHFARPLLRLTAVILMSAALLSPFIPLILWPFSQRWLFPALLPEEWSLRAWRYLFSPGTRLGTALLTSIWIGLAVTFLSLIAGLPAGRAFGLYRFPGKKLVQYLILAPAIVPGFAAAMGIQIVFITFGLADTTAGVVLVHLIPVLPYVVLIFSGIFHNYNLDIEESARSLGANRWQVFRYVTIPSILPGIAAAGLFAFTISWGQYLLTLLIGGGRVLTLPILLLNFTNSGDYTVASAVSLVMIVPAGFYLWFISRYLISQNKALGGFGRL